MRNTDADTDSGSSPGSMRARLWVIAANFHSPSDYGIPERPVFRAKQEPCGAVALYADDPEPFIVAESPMDVRR